MSAEGNGWTNQIIGMVASVLGALIALVYNSTHKRIDTVEQDIERKADHEHMMLAASKIDKLYEALNTHVSDESRQFGQLYDAIHRNHIEVIRELNKKADRGFKES